MRLRIDELVLFWPAWIGRRAFEGFSRAAAAIRSLPGRAPRKALGQAGSAAAVLWIGIARAGIVTIDFESGAGSPGEAIGGAYGAEGVIFTNATWVTAASTYPYPYPEVFFSGQAGLGALEGCQSVATWAFPCETSPIRAFFPIGATWVSVEAYDVGENGARLRAYDEAGRQVGPDQTVVGEGYGVGNGPLELSATGADIQSIALDEPFYYDNGGFPDGIGFDNLRFNLKPALNIISSASGQIQLSWNSATNAIYQIEFLDCLKSNQWSVVGQSLAGTGTNVSIRTAIVQGRAAGFYRLVVNHAH